MIRVRQTRPSDYLAVATILRKCHLAGAWFTKELFTRMLRRNRGLYFVAEINKKVVGTAFASHDGGYMGHMYKLGVLPKYRRRGIATKLTAVRIAALKKRGIDWVFCHVEKKNKNNLALLKKFGFKPKRTHYLVDNF